jgi:hypothetical protein
MKVIAIDIDGTALQHPDEVNRLYEDRDVLVVMYTARSEAVRRRTESELAEAGVRYHALVMGKLRADVYVDDRNAGGLVWP